MTQKRELSKQIKTYQDSSGVLVEDVLGVGGANKSRAGNSTGEVTSPHHSGMTI